MTQKQSLRCQFLVPVSHFLLPPQRAKEKHQRPLVLAPNPLSDQAFHGQPKDNSTRFQPQAYTTGIERYLCSPTLRVLKGSHRPPTCSAPILPLGRTLLLVAQRRRTVFRKRGGTMS